MVRRLSALLLLLLCAGPWLASPLAAASFPNRPVEVVVAWAPGGGADLVFRALAAVFPKHANGQPLLVKNIAGAAGVPGIVEFSKSKPDGYTVLHWNTAHVIKPHMSKVPFTATSFEPVLKVVSGYNYLQTKADSPFQNLTDFLEAAKKNPGKVSVGNAGPGGGNHFAALLLEDYTKTSFLHVPFQGGGPSVTGLLSGQVQTAMNIAPEGLSNVEAGQTRILAVFAPSRFERFPKFPTAKEQGVDLIIDQWRGVVAPKGTPPDIVKALHDIFKKCVEDPDYVKRAKEMNVEPTYLGSKELGELIAADDKRFEKIVKEKKLGDRY